MAALLTSKRYPCFLEIQEAIHKMRLTAFEGCHDSSKSPSKLQVFWRNCPTRKSAIFLLKSFQKKWASDQVWDLLGTPMKDATKVFAMNWRFFPTLDPQVDVYHCRDLDSRFSQREVAAVQEFMSSGLWLTDIWTAMRSTEYKSV